MVQSGNKENINQDTVQTSGATIMDLNDDCLIDIFKRLPVRDLCSVAEVNTRFKQDAKYVFSALYKRFHTLVLVLQSAKGRYEITLNEMRSILKNFGSLIIDLDVSKMSFKSTHNNRILDLIIKYCAGALKELTLEWFSIKGNILQKLRPIFESLEKLSLDNCEINNSIGSLLKNCKELKKLKVCNQDYIDRNCNFIEQQFPQLESICFKSVDMIKESNLLALFTKNPNIKKIKIIRCEYITDKLFKLVADNLKDLEKLTVSLTNYSSSFTQNLEPIKNLENLKKLQLKCGHRSISTIISNLESNDNLTHLVLGKTIADEQLIDSLCAMPNLSVLKLVAVQNFKESYLKEIGKNMCDLTELELTDCRGVSNDAIIKLVNQTKQLQTLSVHEVEVNVDETLYNRLLEIVQARLNKTKLVVSSDTVSIPKSMFIKNRDILEIMETESEYYLDDSDSNSLFSDDDDDDFIYDYDSDNYMFGYAFEKFGFYFGYDPDSDSDDNILF